VARLSFTHLAAIWRHKGAQQTVITTAEANKKSGKIRICMKILCPRRQTHTNNNITKASREYLCFAVSLCVCECLRQALANINILMARLIMPLSCYYFLSSPHSLFDLAPPMFALFI